MKINFLKKTVTSVSALAAFIMLSAGAYAQSVQLKGTVYDEAVAIGYGTMIKRDLSSSVSSVSSDALNERASAINITQSLAGKMAGVSAMTSSGRPGGSMRLLTLCTFSTASWMLTLQ